jgi:hypothetical protein
MVPRSVRLPVVGGTEGFSGAGAFGLPPFWFSGGMEILNEYREDSEQGGSEFEGFSVE